MFYSQKVCNIVTFYYCIKFLINAITFIWVRIENKGYLTYATPWLYLIIFVLLYLLLFLPL